MGATSWNQRWLSVIGSLSICVKWAKCVPCARRIRRGRANEKLCEHARGLYMQMVEFPRQTSKYHTILQGLWRSLLTTPDIKLFFERTNKNKPISRYNSLCFHIARRILLPDLFRVCFCLWLIMSVWVMNVRAPMHDMIFNVTEIRRRFVSLCNSGTAQTDHVAALGHKHRILGQST